MVKPIHRGLNFEFRSSDLAQLRQSTAGSSWCPERARTLGTSWPRPPPAGLHVHQVVPRAGARPRMSRKLSLPSTRAAPPPLAASATSGSTWAPVWPTRGGSARASVRTPAARWSHRSGGAEDAAYQVGHIADDGGLPRRRCETSGCSRRGRRPNLGRAAALRRAKAASPRRPGEDGTRNTDRGWTVFQIPSTPGTHQSRWIGLVWPRWSEDSVVLVMQARQDASWMMPRQRHGGGEAGGPGPSRLWNGLEHTGGLAGRGPRERRRRFLRGQRSGALIWASVRRVWPPARIVPRRRRQRGLRLQGNGPPAARP
ncbi:hypothetical protein PVAP13_6NG340166 [Panicum virgatum]|uniref:Uncharacterized protein n=1 Tax=Panicum virgatum TaxID=38727 RepID=A0A8T0R4B7_PANVG|nr:hypothetical protein PVAP13_6NG340166 [Panicum virgatum]